MEFASVAEFLRMGGYAPYIWPSYAIAVGALIWVGWRSRVALRRAEQAAAAAERRRADAR